MTCWMARCMARWLARRTARRMARWMARWLAYWMSPVLDMPGMVNDMLVSNLHPCSIP